MDSTQCLALRRGDWVSLFGWGDGENGPHPDDLLQPPRFARVKGVVTHPNNHEFVTGICLREYEPQPYGDGDECAWSLNNREETVKPGTLHKVVTPYEVAKAVSDWTTGTMRKMDLDPS